MRRHFFSLTIGALTLLCAMAGQAQEPVQPPKLEFAFEVRAQVADPLVVGELPNGTRRIIDILGGTVEGSGISGKILPGGADWQLIRREDGFTDIDARYTIETDSGSLIYVSNIGGDPSAKDGNGYISTVSPEGDILEEQWATGMNAPKGLALDGGTLYVSDIDELVAIDTETGEITGRYPAEGAQFLNDVAAANGVVYVTDSGTGRIHRLEGDSFTVWVDDPRIQSPNGIYVVDGEIVVAAADSSAAEPGQERYLWTISPDGTELEPLGGTTPLGGLDAVEPDGQGGFFLSDWGGAIVMHFTPGDSARTLVEVSQGTADFDYVAESGMLYLPVMVAGRLIAYEATWGSESNGMQ